MKKDEVRRMKVAGHKTHSCTLYTYILQILKINNGSQLMALTTRIYPLRVKWKLIMEENEYAHKYMELLVQVGKRVE